MTPLKRSPFAVAVLFFVFFTGTLTAQRTQRAVKVPISAIGDGNTPVAGLKQENFQLLDENKEQQIAFFSPDNTPMSVSIILGAGALVRSDRVSEKILDAVDAFKKAGNPANEYFVDPYGTSGVEDAIARGLEKLAGSKNGRKILIMFIDNFDAPATAEQGSLESAMKQDVPIYFMFMKNQFFRFSGTPTTTEDLGAYPTSWMNVFEDVATDTGGRVISTEPMGNLRDESVKLADELKNQYVLGFASGDVKAGQWRSLKVNIRGVAEQQKLTLRYKRRYFVFK
jgi:hypothetical protein